MTPTTYDSRTRAGLKLRGIPKKDHKFEDRLYEIRRRIWRQEALLATMEAQHQGLFPDAIHQSTQGEGSIEAYSKTNGTNRY